jgi:peptide/nickel transport system substrate-binding protein
MKRLTWLKLVGLFTVFVLLFSACSQSNPTPTDTPEETSPPEEVVEEETEEDVSESPEDDVSGAPLPQIEVYSETQAADPIEFEMTRLLVNNMQELGIDAVHRPMPWLQFSDIVWFQRDTWQMTAWRMVGRPERMDPDEFVVNLFHSSTAEKGYNFVGYENPEYDQLAMEQRGLTDPEERREVIYKAQELIAEDIAYVYVAHPKLPFAYRTDVWDPDTIVDAQGIGIKNFWTWIEGTPVGDQKDFIVNTSEDVDSIKPLYISGDADSRVTELIWDRVMRIGPDGLPEPWAAETVEWEDDLTAVVTLREGMTWHDGEPVTADDLIFSFEVPATGEAPMYEPFVSKIGSMEKVDDLTVRFTLSEPWVAFETASLAKVNLIPKHLWEPIIEDLLESEDNAESYQEEVPIGSGPYRFVNWKASEEVVLERYDDHFSPPQAERWIRRIIPNVESALGQLKTGELNFLMEWTGDATILADTAASDPNIELVATTELGFRFFAMNLRLEPFDDLAFRKAIAHAVPRDAIIQNIFKGYGVPADSYVSAAIEYWHNPDLPQYEYSLDTARSVLEEAGYSWDGDGNLLMPSN